MYADDVTVIGLSGAAAIGGVQGVKLSPAAKAAAAGNEMWGSVEAPMRVFRFSSSEQGFRPIVGPTTSSPARLRCKPSQKKKKKTSLQAGPTKFFDSPFPYYLKADYSYFSFTLLECTCHTHVYVTTCSAQQPSRAPPTMAICGV
jgi:hypothetical protein